MTVVRVPFLISLLILIASLLLRYQPLVEVPNLYDSENVILITGTTLSFLEAGNSEAAVIRNMLLFTNLVSSGFRVYFYLNDDDNRCNLVVDKMQEWLKTESHLVMDMKDFVHSFTYDDIRSRYTKIDEIYLDIINILKPSWFKGFLWSHHDATYAYWFYNINKDSLPIKGVYVMEADVGISGDPSKLFRELDQRPEDFLRCDINSAIQSNSWLKFRTPSFHELVGDLKFSCCEHFQRISARVINLIDVYYMEGIIGWGEMYLPSILLSQDERKKMYVTDVGRSEEDDMVLPDLSLNGKYPQFRESFTTYDLRGTGYIVSPYYQMGWRNQWGQLEWDDVKGGPDKKIYHKVNGF